MKLHGGHVGLALAAMVGFSQPMIAAAALREAETDDPYSWMRSTLRVTGIVRDFRDAQTAGGHPDFNIIPSAGAGHYMGMVQDELCSQGKPQFKSTGYKVISQFRDGQGRPIIGCTSGNGRKSYIKAKQGDTMGQLSSTEGGAREFRRVVPPVVPGRVWREPVGFADDRSAA